MINTLHKPTPPPPPALPSLLNKILTFAIIPPHYKYAIILLHIISQATFALVRVGQGGYQEIQRDVKLNLSKTRLVDNGRRELR